MARDQCTRASAAIAEQRTRRGRGKGCIGQGKRDRAHYLIEQTTAGMSGGLRQEILKVRRCRVGDERGKGLKNKRINER